MPGVGYIEEGLVPSLVILSPKIFGFKADMHLYAKLDILVEQQIDFFLFRKLEEEKGKIYDPARWVSFVANNLPAYTAIFQQLLPRFMRIDLVAPKNALMLFRVTKVHYFGPNVIPLSLKNAKYIPNLFIIGVFTIVFDRNFVGG